MKHDLKTGILLITIGIFATISLVVITGRQAIARSNIPNPAYTFGICVYKMQGNISACYNSVRYTHLSQ